MISYLAVLLDDTEVWRQPIKTQTRWWLTLCQVLKSISCGKRWTLAFIKQPSICLELLEGRVYIISAVFFYSKLVFICTSRPEIEITVILDTEPWNQLNGLVFIFLRLGDGPLGPLISKSAFVFEVRWFNVLFSKIELIAMFSSWSTANYSEGQLVWPKQLMHNWPFLLIHVLGLSWSPD